MTNTSQPIGIFDSGVGGLTVFKEIRRALPEEDILYLGDTARVPYGIRSPETVRKYALANANFLVKQNVKLLIIACNTASAIAMSALHAMYDMPIIDVVRPGARSAAAVTKRRRVGIIGTEATIRSRAYEQELERIDSSIVVYQQSCPLFVPLAEEGWCEREDPIATMIANRYLAPLKETGIDTLVLGCTHYPILKDVIQHVVGHNIVLVDSAEEIARETVVVLERSGLRRRDTRQGSETFFVTDIPTRFQETGSRFLGHELNNVHLVDIIAERSS
ncbi:MAG: glutamate racemase [Desulfobacterota bacterium]|nr:glutamate racemase [Thermodesulfobacteriota bacterium]